MGSKELWWHEYRRRKYPPRKIINVENAFRNILKKCYKEYTINSAMPAVRQIYNPDITLRERILWMIVYGFLIGILIYFFLHIWFESLSNPLVVSMESSSYPISNIDFPAVAICNVNRISKKAMIAFEKNIYNRTPNHDLTNMKTWQLGRLIDFSYNDVVESFLIEDVIQKGVKFAHKIIDGMKALAPRCEEMLLSCMWAGKSVNCEDIFDVRRTIKGHCCTFNYVLDYNAAGTPNKTISEVKHQSRPGSLYGLDLIIDPMIEDYAYTTRRVQGLEILLFDPTHFADPTGGRVIQRIAEPNTALFLELDSIKQHALREVRYYNLQTRRCLFHDERKQRFNMYSYSACIVDCRIKTVHSLCRCTPYFLPTSSDLPTCTLYDLECLNKYKEKLLFMYPIDATSEEGLEVELLNSLYCPDCLPDCEFTKHVTKTAKVPISRTKRHGVKNFENYKYIPSYINITNKCLVSIFQSTFYGTLNRLEVVSYWYEVVSNVGGIAGILIGLSITSILEFIYFFVIKFIVSVINLFFY